MARYFGILIIGLLFFSSMACGKKEAEKPEPAVTVAVKRSVDPKMQIWGAVNDQILWRKKLYKEMQKDIRWGLDEREASLLEMILIPGGEAVIGCDRPPRQRRECLSLRTIHVEAFFIDRMELSNARYAECVKERQCLPAGKSDHIPGHDEPLRPVLLTFRQAERYCLWAGKRLPTEYEWEKAARGREGRLYPWGDDPPDASRANICGRNCPMSWADKAWRDNARYTASVGSFPPGESPYGLMDMAGNVKEWVREAPPSSTREKEEEGIHFIARGASWYSDRLELFSFYRQVWKPGVRLDDKGVRCARAVSPVSKEEPS